MRLERVLLTPQLATELLSRNTANRHLTMRHVLRIASDITAGRYVENPQPLAVAADGTLYDGQHRCAAVVKAGVPVPVWIAYDCEPPVRHVIDVDIRPRQLRDILDMQGVRNYAVVPSLARFGLMYDKYPGIVWGTGSSWLSQPEVAAYADTFMSQLQEVVPVHSAVYRDKSTILPPSAVAVAAFVITRDTHQESETVADFLDGLLSGAGLSAGDPRLALRRLNAKAAAPHWRTQMAIGAVIKGWNSYARDDAMQLARFRKSELPMPKAL
jgi:hypothetical protein